MSELVILTADDPEPPVGSVVLDCEGDAWQRSSLGHEWCVVKSEPELPWRDLNFQLGPLTLVYRGPDTDPPATWRGGDGTPPDGTIVADDHLAPWMLEEGRWRCSTGSRSVSCDVNQLTRPCHVLRWGWTK